LTFFTMLVNAVASVLRISATVLRLSETLYIYK